MKKKKNKNNLLINLKENKGMNKVKKKRIK